LTPLGGVPVGGVPVGVVDVLDEPDEVVDVELVAAEAMPAVPSIVPVASAPVRINRR
jgi:hypothetical protein